MFKLKPETVRSTTDEAKNPVIRNGFPGQTRFNWEVNLCLKRQKLLLVGDNKEVYDAFDEMSQRKSERVLVFPETEGKSGFLCRLQTVRILMKYKKVRRKNSKN